MNYDFINNPDPRIIAFQKALGQKESNNTPTPANTRITLTEGSVGRFQYLPETFKKYSKQYFGGVNPTTGKPLDITNDFDQKIVNYAYIKDKMDQGYSPYDVAASWNAGEGRINDWQNMRGVNKYGNKYDVPAYANEVVHNFKQYAKQVQDNTYEPVAYNPKIHTPENAARDEDVALQLREQELQREKDLEEYKNQDPILPFLDPVTDSMADFSEGFNKNAQRTIGEIATTANDLFNFSDNPMLIRGSKSNDQFINKATEADNTTQTVGDWTTAGLKFAAEAYTGTKLANATLGAVIGGKSSLLQKALLTQGVSGTLARAGFTGALESVPFTVEQVLRNPDDFGLAKDVALPTAIAMVAGLVLSGGRTAMVGNVLNRVGKLHAEGKLEEAAKLMSSKEFTIELAKNGIRNDAQLAAKIKSEIPVVKNALQEILPTTAATKVSNMSDDAVQQFSANFSKTLDSNGNFNTIDDINRIRKATSELMENSEELSKSLSKQLTLTGKNIDLDAMKAAMIRDVEQRVASRELLTDEGDKFIRFIEKNFLTKPSKNGAFYDLHKMRKNLNLDFTNNDYDASRYVADKIRRVVDKMPKSKEMAAYKNANKVYGDLQDAEFLLAKMNKKGANINKATLSSLAGILASGGGFAPVQYFLGQRLGAYVVDKAKRAYTPRLIGNKFSRIGTNPLVDAHRAVKEAVESTSKKITKIEGKITTENAKAFVNTLLRAETPEDVIQAKKLLRSLAKHHEAKQFEKELMDKAAKIKTIHELQDFTLGKGKFKNPKVFEGTGDSLDKRTLGEKAKDKMIKTSVGLPTILSSILGVAVLGGSVDSASAMEVDQPQDLNIIQRMFASDPVEAVPTEEPMIKPAPVEKVPEKKKGVIGGYDISVYATDPHHEAKIEKIYNGVTEKRDFSTSTGIQEAIKDNAPKSKITGKMIKEVADKHDIDPKLLFAIMLQDSQLGTKGMGARNNNPGNVAQYDHLKKATKGYKTLKDGVEAVAKWLKTKKVTD